MSCETCNHWCRSNNPDLEEDFGTCDMQIIDIESSGDSCRWIQHLITRAEHKCLSWEEKK